jgi:hypothetical protein
LKAERVLSDQDKYSVRASKINYSQNNRYESQTMNYRSLVKIHGYLAVFFLPMAVLYAVTGALYIVGTSGEATKETLHISLTNDWPDSIENARQFTTQRLLANGLPAASNRAGEIEIDENTYLWRALSHTVRLTRTNPGQAVIVFQKNSLYRQIVEIHKNHAGGFFAFIGFAFGIAMTILLLSGSLMMIKSKVFRKNALWTLAVGTAACAYAYLSILLF